MMSRIAGVLACQNGPDPGAITARMLQALPTPDGWTAQGLAAGSASLAFTGRSPANIASLDGVCAVVDGRFYNLDELGEPGREARVLAALFARLGLEQALERINGDFAAAILDRDGRTLWLCRDRFGVKPLYYVQGREFVAFASHPTALLAAPGVHPTPDDRYVALLAASHYRVFDNDPEASPYRAIKQLPAACLARFGTPPLPPRRYWSLRDLPDWESGEVELAEGCRELLLDAVKRRLATTERPAFTLSGGMDSSSVLACAALASGRPQDAFSSTYRDKTFDESQEIASMLQGPVGTWRPVPVEPGPDLFSLVKRMVLAHGEPVATATWLSHFLVCESVARAGYDSLFGGLGGDELNAGEYEYFIYHFADLSRHGDSARLEDEIAQWALHHDHPLYPKNPVAAASAMSRLTDSRTGRCLPDTRRLRRYSQVLAPGFFDLNGFEPLMEHPFRSFLKNRTWQDLSRETAPCCLRAEDRQTARFGLDHFLPFLDHRLVEFLYQVPGTMKFHRGVTKHLLRQAMRSILPEETRTRVKKTGWNAPAHVWFSGKNLERVRDMVRSRAFRERGVYDPDQVMRVVDDHERIVTSGALEENHMMFLWQLINLETWLESLAELPAAEARTAPTRGTPASGDTK